MAKKDYSLLSREELVGLLLKYDEKKKYGIVWDEERVPEKVVTDCQTHLPVLTEVPEKAIYTDPCEPTHLLIEGDNYHTLSVLNYTHAGKIDLIYIDPPYNTGNKDFIYNDKYVEEEDVYKHSKWLNFMSKRLELARILLTDNGVIFISIDDNEMAQLKMLCDKVFGQQNFIANFIRKNKAGAGHDSGQIAIEYDYMLCYSKNKLALQFNREILDVENDNKYKLIDDCIDYRGKYYLRDLDYKGSYSPSLDYPIITPDQSEIYSGGKSGKPNTWRWSKEKLKWGIENDFIVFKKIKENWKVYIKQYQYVDNENKIRVRQLPFRALVQFLNSEGSQELQNIVRQNIFSFPKSTSLIEFCINLMPSNEIIVLDFFAGSGTTGHAVLNSNKKDNGKRKFILCTNNDNQICQNVTYPRVANVINGYVNLKNDKVEGIGGNLKYFKTSFVENVKNRDQIRLDITRRCTEMICVKEGIYNSYKQTNNWKIFEHNNNYLAVYYELIEWALEDLKNELNKLNGSKVLYCFTIEREVDLKDFKGWKKTRIETIPQKILDVYRRIFETE